jgi:hypothetical protein
MGFTELGGPCQQSRGALLDEAIAMYNQGVASADCRINKREAAAITFLDMQTPEFRERLARHWHTFPAATSAVPVTVLAAPCFTVGVNSHISKSQNEVWHTTFGPSKRKNYLCLLRLIHAFIYRIEAKKTLSGKDVVVSSGNANLFRDPDVTQVYKVACIWDAAEPTIKSKVTDRFESVFSQFTRARLDTEFLEKAKDLNPQVQWSQFRFLLTTDDEVPQVNRSRSEAVSTAESAATYANFRLECVKAEEEGRMWDAHKTALAQWEGKSDNSRITYLGGRHDLIVSEVKKMMDPQYYTEVQESFAGAMAFAETKASAFAEAGGILSEGLWRIMLVNLNIAGSAWQNVLNDMTSAVVTKINQAPDRTCGVSVQLVYKPEALPI